MEIQGIIGVFKPEGWTSFDVIAKLRGILHIKRLGHAGTLDPMATGVLPVFIGKATKSCDILPDKRKRYTAGFRLGIATDTLDITGKILSTCDKEISYDEINNVLDDFKGEIIQLPPMYSAVKVNGKKLYELAREGKTVERKPRKAYVYDISLTSYDPEKREGILNIDCGEGTYVRTIIDDIGKKLGVYGTMTSLVRTYSGGIDIKDTHTLEEIQKICNENTIDSIIMPTDKVFEIYDSVTLDKKCTALYKNGVKLRPVQAGFETYDDKKYRVYGSDGEFLGLGYFDKKLFRCFKNFY